MPESAPRKVVPLRAHRRGDRSVLVRVAGANPVVADDLDAASARLLLSLGATTTVELRALAGRTSAVATANVLRHLADSAERASQSQRSLGRVLVSGISPLQTSLLPVLQAYCREVSTVSHLAGPQRDVDLVISITAESFDLDWCARWREIGVTVLPVLLRGDRVSVGPLLIAGGAICARCVELHRLDRDPTRAHLLSGADPGLHDGDQLRLDPALSAISVGLVGMLARCLGEGAGVPQRVSLSAALPYPEIRHHEWLPHPRCGHR